MQREVAHQAASFAFGSGVLGGRALRGAYACLYVQGKGREQKGDFVVLTDSAARPIYAYLSMRRERDRGAPLFAALSNETMERRLKTRSLREVVKRAKGEKFPSFT